MSATPDSLSTTPVELRIAEIEDRNRRVELEKAWETSLTRKLSIFLLTYVVMSLIFWTLGSAAYFRDAIIPTTGYFLSTLSLPLVKAVWIKRYSR